MHAVRLLQMDSVRPGEERAVFQGLPQHRVGKFHSYSAGGRLITALSLMEGRSTVTEKVKESVFKCNLCGQCDVSCKICRYDMEPLEAMREMRATLVQGRPRHCRNWHPVIDGLRTEFNMLGQPAERRGDWADELKVKDLLQEKAEVRLSCRMPLLVRRRSGPRGPDQREDSAEGGRGFRHLGQRARVLRRASPRHGIPRGLTMPAPTAI